MTDPGRTARSITGFQESIREPNLLLVEGKEDRLVFNELRNHWGLADIQIIEMEGIRNLNRRLNVLVRDPGFGNLRTLGVTTRDVVPSVRCGGVTRFG